MGLGEFHSRCLPRRLTFGPPMIWALFYFFHFYSPSFPFSIYATDGEGKKKRRAGARQGMKGWKCKGRGTGGRGLGDRAYLFSGMRQVRYPQLRLAHLFMLNATPWEARPCHRKYRNPFFSLSAVPTDCLICSFHLSDLGIHRTHIVDILLALLSSNLGSSCYLIIWLPDTFVAYFCLIQSHVRP